MGKPQSPLQTVYGLSATACCRPGPAGTEMSGALSMRPEIGPSQSHPMRPVKAASAYTGPHRAAQRPSWAQIGRLGGWGSVRSPPFCGMGTKMKPCRERTSQRVRTSSSRAGELDRCTPRRRPQRPNVHARRARGGRSTRLKPPRECGCTRPRRRVYVQSEGGRQAGWRRGPAAGAGSCGCARTTSWRSCGISDVGARIRMARDVPGSLVRITGQANAA